jgi:NAD(P)-dependent dehydrogenase (short-subunit alcohol dehydrogenase family)
MKDAQTEADIRRCSELLEAIVQDRSLLIGLSDEERRRFLMAAGKVSRPTKNEMLKLTRATRKLKKRVRYEADCQARAETGIRAARAAPVFVAPERAIGASAERPRLRLEKPRHCYVCKADFDVLHHFYDSMCDECAEFNYAKRFQTADLRGRVAVITGARVKIGYQAALMMLRAGAQVVVSTRFPHDAASRFAREADFDAFADRLLVHGLDLRHAPSVELYAQYLCSSLDRLDFLINNAAQTVRRPPGFYAHLLAAEHQATLALGPRERHVLRSHVACSAALTREGATLPSEVTATALTAFAGVDALAPGIGLRASAALSQIPYSFDDANLGREVFPVGHLDADLQQVDLRRENSWRLTLAHVQTPEMIEVQLVNAVAPFILCSKLKPLMLRDKTGDKHIVNVSAIEGQFARHTKTDKHPHTNMAKAALNMMTLTSAPDYVKDGIHMNAVDTGWVTDEDPIEITQRKQAEIDFHPPLDIVDGAARICDPFMEGLNTGHHVWGKFLKDYKQAPW